MATSIPYQPSQPVMQPVDTTNDAAKLAQIFGQAMQTGAQAATAYANANKDLTNTAADDAKRMAAEAKYQELSKDAEAELTKQGYRFQSEQSVQDIQNLRAKNELDMFNLPAELGKYNNDYSKFLVDNPGATNAVRREVETIQANKDIIDSLHSFDIWAADPQNADKVASNLDGAISEHINNTLNSKPYTDYQNSLLLDGLTNRFEQEKLKRTITQLDKERKDAIDSADITLGDKFATNIDLKNLDRGVLQELIDSHVASIKNIDNSRTETDIRSDAIKTLGRVIINMPNVVEAKKAFDNLAPSSSDPEEMQAVFKVVGHDILQRYNAMENKLISDAKTSINENSPLNDIVSVKTAFDKNQNISEAGRVEMQLYTQNLALSIYKKNIDSSQTRDGINMVLNNANAVSKGNVINSQQLLSLKQYAQKRGEEVKNESIVADRAAKKPGYELSIPSDDQNKAIDKRFEASLQPSISPTGEVVQKPYSQALLESFRSQNGYFTPSQYNTLSSLVNNPAITTNDPELDQKNKFMGTVEAATVFFNMTTDERAIVLDDMKKNKISSGKLQAIAGSVIYFGSKPGDVANWLASVPSSDFDTAMSKEVRPPLNDYISSSYHSGSMITRPFDWSGATVKRPDVVGIGKEASDMFLTSYLINYGIAKRDNPLAEPAALAQSALSAAQKQFADPSNTYVVALGNFNNIAIKAKVPLSSDRSVILSELIDKAIPVLSAEYIEMRYGKVNTDYNNYKVSEDGTSYMFPVYRIDVPNGSTTPVGYWKFPIADESQRTIRNDLKNKEYTIFYPATSTKVRNP